MNHFDPKTTSLMASTLARCSKISPNLKSKFRKKIHLHQEWTGKAPFVGTKNINTLWFFMASNILFTFSEGFRLWTDGNRQCCCSMDQRCSQARKRFNNTIFVLILYTLSWTICVNVFCQERPSVILDITNLTWVFI